jgi:hypothetical protein
MPSLRPLFSGRRSGRLSRSTVGHFRRYEEALIPGLFTPDHYPARPDENQLKEMLVARSGRCHLPPPVRHSTDSAETRYHPYGVPERFSTMTLRSRRATAFAFLARWSWHNRRPPLPVVVNMLPVLITV